MLSFKEFLNEAVYSQLADTYLKSLGFSAKNPLKHNSKDPYVYQDKDGNVAIVSADSRYATFHSPDGIKTGQIGFASVAKHLMPAE